MTHEQRPVLSDNFELQDNRLLRQFRHNRRIRNLVPSRPAPRFKQFAVMFFYHTLGRFVFHIRYWLDSLKQRVKSVINHHG